MQRTIHDFRPLMVCLYSDAIITGGPTGQLTNYNSPAIITLIISFSLFFRAEEQKLIFLDMTGRRFNSSLIFSISTPRELYEIFREVFYTL